MQQHTGKSLDYPEETREFDKGKMDVVNLDGVTVGRLRAGLEFLRRRPVRQGSIPGRIKLRGTGPSLPASGDEFP